MFPQEHELEEFQQSDEYSKVFEMLTVLRSHDLPENDLHEQQRMITVRVPKCLHDSICDEAKALKVSVNILGVSKSRTKADPSSNRQKRGKHAVAELVALKNSLALSLRC